MNNQQQNEQNREERERKERSIAEITVVIFCSIIVIFLVAYSVYHAIVAPSAPPKLLVSVLFDEVVEQDGRYVLPVEIINTSYPTVEDVRVEIKVISSDHEQSIKEVNIAYLPEHSKDKIFVVSEEKPVKDNIQINIQSFRVP